MNRTLSVAPMMDCTDRHFRAVLRILSPNALLYSEMVTTGALLHGDAARFLDHSADEPSALQLGGSDPKALARSAQLGEAAGYAEINLNCGCPSDRVQQGGIGACLMAEPELVADCYQAMSEAVNVPVTIKSRIGIDDRDSFGFFCSFIDTLYQRGCRVFIVHARKAILAGLSPKENREIPPLHYDYVYRAQPLFPEATFILNGGLTDVASVRTVLDAGMDGVMLGRAIYNAPLLLSELDAALFGSKPDSIDKQLQLIRAYVESQLANGVALKHMARHLLGLFAGMPGARRYRRCLSTGMTAADAGIALFDEAVGEVSLADESRLRLVS